MGCGSYSYSAYAGIEATRGFKSRDASSICSNAELSTKSDIRNSNINARTHNNKIKSEMINTGVRECRDTEEHPNSTPIIIALDVTGSMYDTPAQMIKDSFPKIMRELNGLDIKDPQLLFMAIGDHEWDNYPIQVGQFESDTERIINSLQDFVLEGGGGGNLGESYSLAHIIAGYHTETDAWYKRNKKGFLFTIGDEPNLHTIDGASLEKFLGYQKPANSITEEEALSKAREQYNIFHIHITNGSHGTIVPKSWESLLGQNVLTSNSENIHKVIAKAIKSSMDSYYSESCCEDIESCNMDNSKSQTTCDCENPKPNYPTENYTY